jgi:DNA polymerase V
MIFRKGYQYKKAGVVVMDFTPEDTGQISLFENSDPRHRLVMDVVDRMNTAIGQKKVKLASQALDRTWKMKQEKLSPRYTTRIGEVITVLA